MLGVLLGACLTPGCASARKQSAAPPGITTSADRIVQLRELAKNAKSATPEEQERVSLQLARMIQHQDDPSVRIEILRTLAKYPTPTAGTVLHAALSDSDPDVRCECCRAWGQRGGQDSVRELSQALASDTNIDVRIAAARALGTTEQPGALNPLTDALADTDPALRYRTLESLRGISGEDFGPDVDAWRQYAQSGAVEKEPQSIAERFRNLFR
jgi:HEAT repeat protein